VSSPRARTRTVDAPAKVNLFLRVIGRRDDGYHDLHTLILPISLADRLVFHADADLSFPTLSLSLDVTGQEDVTREVPPNESNLAVRAATALAERTGIRGFAHITLEKEVPASAGLGGGSADAAAVLRVLNDLWSCGLSMDELSEVAASVGSDVPALLFNGPVEATGRGERVRAGRCRSLDLIVVTFPFGVSTPEAFAWWDEEGPTGPHPGSLLEACRPGEGDLATIGSLLFNDLEGPVIRRHPVIGEAKRVLADGGVAGAVMSGSGPTVVGLVAEGPARLDGETERALARLAGQPPVYVRTLAERIRSA
jgi:4-diphosphocytidyl-2-C-methyl-D-erythritol kinase